MANTRKRPPGRGLEARENQLISLAVDLAEKQLMNGTASAQVIVHYLKLGTTVNELEKERLRHENQLLEAKTSSLKAAENSQALFAEAIQAMRDYSPGNIDPGGGNEEDI